MAIKTTAKKVVVKKKEAKKTIPKVLLVKKAGKKKPLVIASGETCFWVNNGSSLSSLKDLRDALRTMTAEQFFYHTGMGRNDFSSWVLYVFGDKQCADDLLKAKTMKEALSVVEKSLKAYMI